MSPNVNLENLRDLLDPSLSLDADGSLSFRLDGQTVILRPQEDTLVVHVTLGTVPDPALGFVMQFLLEDNFLLGQSRGGAYSIHGDLPVLGIDFRLPPGWTDETELMNELNSIIVTADACRERLEGALASHYAKLRAELQDLHEFGGDPDALNSPGLSL